MRNKFFVSLIFIFSFSCARHSPELEEILQLAGNNRRELEKVLRHYGKNPHDTLKLRAAEFLIENMPGHFAYDTSELHLYHPILYRMDSMRYYSVEGRMALDAEWNTLKRKYPLQKHVFRQQFDITRITGDYLITHIDSAMSVWQKKSLSRQHCV